MVYINGGKLVQNPNFVQSIAIYFWAFIEFVQLLFVFYFFKIKFFYFNCKNIFSLNFFQPNSSGSTTSGRKSAPVKGGKVNSMNHQDSFNPSAGCGPSG
jgi:hypothetical protein